MLWTAEKIEQLRSLHAAGLRWRELMEVFGATKGSIIGKLWRLGLCPPKDRSPEARERSLLRRLERRRAAARERRPGKPRPRRPAMKGRRGAMMLLAEEPDLPAPEPLPILALADGVCRWPVDARHEDGRIVHLFCGRPGYPYCPRHALLACNPSS
jgi:hypothetical protein